MIGYQGIVEVSWIYPKAFSEDFHPRIVGVDRLLPKPLFTWAKAFFDKSKARSRPCQNSPIGHGHVIVKPNLLIFKVLAGYGYLFFGLCPT